MRTMEYGWIHRKIEDIDTRIVNLMVKRKYYVKMFEKQKAYQIKQKKKKE